MTNTPDIERLAQAITARRAELAAMVDVSPDVRIEVLAAKLRVGGATVAAEIERREHWASGSVEAILAGGDPTPLPGRPPSTTRKRRRGMAPAFWSVATPTEADIDRVVVQARAIVDLAEVRDALEAECEQLEAKVAERDESLRRSSDRQAELRKRLFAVAHELHGEATQVACGDGCCHEGTGVCQYCDEAWPCKTARVAEGNDAEDAT